MPQEYGKFKCPVCGKDVFVLLPLHGPDGQNNGFQEITCPKGHTDTYDFISLKKLLKKDLESLNIQGVMVAVG